MSSRVLSTAMLAGLIATSGSPASAEDIVAYQADGDAPATSPDARTMALDAAFANAVTNALGELVAPDVRTARKGDIDREIIGRARLWVAKFSVTKDETIENRRELAVSVRIDRDKLRSRLDELGVATKAAVAPQPTTGEEPAGAAPAKTVTILARLASPSGAQASYGDGAVGALPGVGALTKLLRDHGYAVRQPPTKGSAGELTEDTANALAAAAKADSYAIANVTIAEPVPVRGRGGTASLVTATVRLVERDDHTLTGQGKGIAAVLGDTSGANAESSINRALAFATSDVFPRVPTKLAAASAFDGDDVPLADAGVVLVRLPAKTPFASVLAEQKFLAGAKGVRSASLRRMSPSGWVLGVVTSQSIEQVARIAKKAPATDTRASVKIVGEVVEVTLQGAP